MTMGGKGSCHIHGLSCHHVTSEKEAADLYELGISNRKIVDSDGSCGQRSSRSHLIFTIALSRQKDGAEIIFRFVRVLLLHEINPLLSPFLASGRV